MFPVAQNVLRLSLLLTGCMSIPMGTVGSLRVCSPWDWADPSSWPLVKGVGAKWDLGASSPWAELPHGQASAEML